MLYSAVRNIATGKEHSESSEQSNFLHQSRSKIIKLLDFGFVSLFLCEVQRSCMSYTVTTPRKQKERKKPKKLQTGSQRLSNITQTLQTV